MRRPDLKSRASLQGSRTMVHRPRPSARGSDSDYPWQVSLRADGAGHFKRFPPLPGKNGTFLLARRGVGNVEWGYALGPFCRPSHI